MIEPEVIGPIKEEIKRYVNAYSTAKTGTVRASLTGNLETIECFVSDKTVEYPMIRLVYPIVAYGFARKLLAERGEDVSEFPEEIVAHIEDISKRKFPEDITKFLNELKRQAA